MPVTDWDAEISDEERENLIAAFAKRVDERGLHVPAILFLEMHKPFAFLASQSLVLGSGFLAPLFGADKVQRYSKLIESRANVELMIRRIEEIHATRQQKA